MRHVVLRYSNQPDGATYALVFAPSGSLWPLVDAHHQAMRQELEKLAPEFWLDSVCFERLAEYYRNIMAYLDERVDVGSLAPESRHRFFVTQGVEERRVKLSLLQELLGYSAPESGSDSAEEIQSDLLTTGQADIDLVAEMHLLGLPVEFLISRYSLTEMLSLTSLLWSRKLRSMGGEVSPGSTRPGGSGDTRSDLELWESIPAEVREASRQKALTELLFTTGLGRQALYGNQTQGISADDSQIQGVPANPRSDN